MTYDIFISYAWGSPSNDRDKKHRDWVRLLASHLQLIGFNIRIDANVEYGDRV